MSSNITDQEYVTLTNTSLATSSTSDLLEKSYSLGAIFGLIGAASRAGHYVTCKIILEKKSTSTNWIILFSGLGGFMVSLMSSVLDSDHLLLSARITQISASNWTGQSSAQIDLKYTYSSNSGMLLIASLGVSALFFLNKALSLASPVVVSFIRVTDIVVSYLLQVLVLHDDPSILAIVGSSFVIVSVSLLSVEQYLVRHLPAGVRYLF